MFNGEREKFDLQALTTVYDIGSVNSLRRLTGGLVNNVYKIDTSTGQYVLKEYRNTHVEKLEEEVRLLSFLKARGFPIPDIIDSKSGATITTIFNRLGYLYKFVDGYNPSEPNELTHNQVREAASALGIYHSLVEFYKPTNKYTSDFPLYNSNHFFSSQNASELWSKALQIISRKSIIDNVDMQVMSVGQRKLQVLKSIDDEGVNRIVRSLPRLRGHGDYHGGNLIFDGNDRVKAVIDWELNRELARAWEVQYAITLMCKDENTENFNTPLDLEKCKLFIDTYRKNNSISQREIAAMPMMGYVVSLAPFFLLESHYFEGSSKLDRYFPTSMNHWFWWDEYYEKYLNLF